MPEREDRQNREISSHADGKAVARYLADMTGQLEAMARAGKFEVLAFVLSIARAEAESIVLERRYDKDPTPP
jgi:hypothetical protein